MFSCCKTIDKPQQFHRYVHVPLNVREKRFDKDAALPEKPDPSDKGWRILFSFKELQGFFNEREDTLKFSEDETNAINKETSKASSLDEALRIVSASLEKKFIHDGYFDFSDYNVLRDMPGGAGLGLVYKRDGKDQFFNYYSVIAGGIKNMFATTLSLARITPELIKTKAKASFSDMKTFIDRVKTVAKKNIDLLIGFSKLDISLLFKFLNIIGKNNHQEKRNYDFYDFDQKYFTLDDVKNPSQILSYKKLAIDLIKSMKKDPSYCSYGHRQAVEPSKIESYGCPAIFVRTKDGKQNIIEFTNDVVNDLLDKTVFNNLDKWVKL